MRMDELSAASEGRRCGPRVNVAGRAACPPLRRFAASGGRAAAPGAAGATRVAFGPGRVVLVAAPWREAGVLDDAPDLRLGHDEIDARGADHVLLEHQGAEVVRSH